MKRFLKAVGTQIRDNFGTGEVVILRGTNLGGWQVMESWMCPTDALDQKTAIKVLTERFGRVTAEELIKTYEAAWWQEEDFDYLKSLNFNVIRLPISYLNLLDAEGRLRQDTLDTYDWFVKECGRRDIYVILDLHCAPGSQNGRDHSGDTSGSKLFHNDYDQDLTVALWEQLAAHYKGNSTIAGYDLLNEPEGDESERSPWGAIQFPFYHRLYQAIRAVDPDHMIIMEAIWDPADMRHPSEFGWENVMYQYHCYGWDGIDDVEQQKRFTDSKEVMVAQAAFPVPVLIGEFNLFSQPASWEYALELYNRNGWSWTTWTYKTVEYGNWGIFNSRKEDTPDVNIHSDSAETIREKWSRMGTDTSFHKNTVLYELLKKHAGSSRATSM